MIESDDMLPYYAAERQIFSIRGRWRPDLYLVASDDKARNMVEQRTLAPAAR
jgi:hypothetical protein